MSTDIFESTILPVLVWGRMAERSAIVLFAGLAVVLGWHLFLRGVVMDQAGILEGKGFKVALQKVGPGIFFALFGSSVLVFSLFSPVKLTAGDFIADMSLSTPQQKKVELVFLNGDDRTEKAYARALNTFIYYPVETEKLPPPLARDWVLARPKLIEMRNSIVARHFSVDDIQKASTLAGPYGLDLTKAEPQDRDMLQRISPWFVDTIVAEPK